MDATITEQLEDALASKEMQLEVKELQLSKLNGILQDVEFAAR
jgi:hypothetical protein